MGDDGGSAGEGLCRVRELLVSVAPNVVRDDPAAVDRVEDGADSDHVRILANSPLVGLLLRVFNRRLRADGVDKRQLGRAPDLVAAGALLNVLAEVGIVVSVEIGDIVTLVALPQTSAGLLLGEVGEALQEVVVVADDSGVHFPVPNEVELGVVLTELLHRQPLGRMHTLLVLVGKCRVEVPHSLVIPQLGNAVELERHMLVEHVLVRGLVVPDVESLVANVQQQENLVLATGSERKLRNEGADDLFVVLGVLLACVGSKKDSSTGVGSRHLGALGPSSELVGKAPLLVGLLFLLGLLAILLSDVGVGSLDVFVGLALVEAGSVSLNALLLEVAPVDVIPVNAKTGLAELRKKTVGPKSGLTLIANVAVHVQDVEATEARVGKFRRMTLEDQEIIDGLASRTNAGHMRRAMRFVPFFAIVVGVGVEVDWSLVGVGLLLRARLTEVGGVLGGPVFLVLQRIKCVSVDRIVAGKPVKFKKVSLSCMRDS